MDDPVKDIDKSGGPKLIKVSTSEAVAPGPSRLFPASRNRGPSSSSGSHQSKISQTPSPTSTSTSESVTPTLSSVDSSIHSSSLSEVGNTQEQGEVEQQRFGLRRLALTEEKIQEFVKRSEACKSNPCLNGGTCVNLDEDEGFVCLCQDKFTGELCESVNNCHRHECVYGVCKNEENGYTCECYDEYVGNRCQRHCPSYLCEHGGTCFIDTDGEYGCICPTGWTGDRCHIDVDDCIENRCQNGAECVDLMNGYECKCADGYMGEICHRPCQNIYKSCEMWEQEKRCAAMRPVTNFFDVNCAASCGQCTFDNSTIVTDTPLAPILEPFEFLIGEWVANYTGVDKYPVDFQSDQVTASYIDKVTFSVAEVLMFGVPSLNFSTVAINDNDHEDQIHNRGFLTLNPRNRPGGPLDVSLVSTGNDGVTMIEEGELDGSELRLKSVHSVVYPELKILSYEKLERNFTLRTPYLRLAVSKTKSTGTRQYYTKYYHRENPVTLF